MTDPKTTLIYPSLPGQDLSQRTLRERRGVTFSISLPPPPYGHYPFARKQRATSESPTSPVSPSYSSSSGSSSRSVSSADAEIHYEPVLSSSVATLPAATIKAPERRRSLRDRRGVGLYVLTSFASTQTPALYDAVIPSKGRLEPTIGNLPRRRKRTTTNPAV